jgi:hypothetical protein
MINYYFQDLHEVINYFPNQQIHENFLYDRDDMGITATMNKLCRRVNKCNDVLFTWFPKGVPMGAIVIQTRFAECTESAEVATSVLRECQQSWALGMRQHFNTQNRHGFYSILK